MKNLYIFAETSLNVMMGGFLLLMGLFLFINIILRYFFSSGIVWAEEISRFLFVWITFIGAVGALKDNKHLGFSMLIKKMRPPLKKFFFIVSNIIVLYILYLVFMGSIQMSELGWINIAPTTGIPLTFMWIVGVISAGFMFFIIIGNMYKAIFVEGAIDALVDLVESEDEAHLEKYMGSDKQP